MNRLGVCSVGAKNIFYFFNILFVKFLKKNVFLWKNKFLKKMKRKVFHNKSKEKISSTNAISH